MHFVLFLRQTKQYYRTIKQSLKSSKIKFSNYTMARIARTRTINEATTQKYSKYSYLREQNTDE